MIGLFVKVLPDVVKSGLLYIVEPALYGWKTKTGYDFTNNFDEIPKGVNFTRYKGLGEMNPDELYYSMVGKDYRKLYQVEYPDDLSRFYSILTSSNAKFDMLVNEGIIKYIKE